MSQQTIKPVQLLKRIRASQLALPQKLRVSAQLAQLLDARAVDLDSPPTVGESTSITTAKILQWSKELNSIVCNQLLPRLSRYRLHIVRTNELTIAQSRWLHRYFQGQIYPLLTPLAIDSGHPFPRVKGGNLYLLVTLQAIRPKHRHSYKDVTSLSFGYNPLTFADGMRGGYTPTMHSDEHEIYGLVKIAEHGRRFISLQTDEADDSLRQTHFILREDLVRHFIGTLFPGMKVSNCYQFRVLRTTPVSVETRQIDGLFTEDTIGAVGNRFDRTRTRLSQLPIAQVDVEERMPS